MTDGPVAAGMPTSSGAESGAEGANVPRSAPEQQKTAPKTGTASHPEKAAPELFEVKVNGRIVKMTRQELMDNASMSHTANQKFNEAKAERAKADAILSKAKSNPIEALIEAGLSKEQIRDTMEKWYAKEFIEPEGMSEEARKLKAAEERLKAYEEQEQRKKEEDEQKQLEDLTAKERAVLQQQIVEAMESSGLPKTKFFASRMAFYMKQNLANGWQAPTSLIVSQVKNEYKGLVSGINQDASVEQLIDLYGEGVINKIRKYDLEKLRSSRNLPPPTGVSGQQSYDTSEKVTSSEVSRRLRDFRSGRSSY